MSSQQSLTLALQDKLTLDDKPRSRPSNGSMRPPQRANTGSVPPPYSATTSASRSENIPPRGPTGHRPTKSQEEAMRIRRAANGSRSRPSGELNIFADPESPAKRPDLRRVRRNSESSVVGSGKPLDSDEEKRRQEKRRRERRHREARDGKDGKDGRPKKTERKLDVIDKLDVTSIYGTGCELFPNFGTFTLLTATVFHHDGPFDACNPNRNRQGSKRAPMSAFAKDSLNNVLGGGGPLNKRPDHATFLGNNDDEAFKDYSKGGLAQNGYESYNLESNRHRPSRQDSNIQSATTKVEPIHGEESLGLGTSTFLEGAPASRTAMQRRESEQAVATEGGLGRKKSLAQKIRGVGNSRREYGNPRVTSPGVMSPVSPRTPALTPGGTEVDSNPFFNEFTKGDDRIGGKKETLTFVEPAKSPRGETPDSPKRGVGERLERRVTSDGSSGADQSAKPTGSGGGFLARVKSLKGGPRKPREKALPQPQIMDS
jgi:hypothetical protein